jgi:hypothetical protein
LPTPCASGQLCCVSLRGIGQRPTAVEAGWDGHRQDSTIIPAHAHAAGALRSSGGQAGGRSRGGFSTIIGSNLMIRSHRSASQQVRMGHICVPMPRPAGGAAPGRQGAPRSAGVEPYSRRRPCAPASEAVHAGRPRRSSPTRPGQRLGSSTRSLTGGSSRTGWSSHPRLRPADLPAAHPDPAPGRPAQASSGALRRSMVAPHRRPKLPAHDLAFVQIASPMVCLHSFGDTA